jgi:hypothetical protein
VDFESYKDWIGYVCIFCRSEAEAVSNLVRLIGEKKSGFTQGPEYWSSSLNEWLTGPYNLEELNRLGARFTVDEWRAIFRDVVAELDRISGPSA